MPDASPVDPTLLEFFDSPTDSPFVIEHVSEEFVTLMDKPADSLASDPEAGMQQMQVRMRERKKLREDLEQIEATIFRRLQEALVTEVGAEKAQAIGELPARRRAPVGTIQIGG